MRLPSLLLALMVACGDDPPPVPTLDDESPLVRKDALYALTEAERLESLPQLLEMAQSDPDESVRQLAIGFAGTTGDDSAIPVFLVLLNDWNHTGPQLAAATALGNLRTTASCEAMLDAIVRWPAPARDMVVNELRSSIVRARKPCEVSVRARLKRHPDAMREILGMMLDH